MTSFPRRPRTAEEARCQRMLDKAPTFVWKRFADGVELRARLFAPAGHSPQAFAPAVMFFHGGMWALEYNEEFVSWAMHLAHRGIVCVLPEYRTHACYEVTAEEIIQDGLDAWGWIHHNAAGLGIDQDRITLAGADAGGLMALNAAMQPMLETRRWWQFGSKDVLPLMPACVAILRGVVDVDAPEARMLNVKVEMQDSTTINPCALLRRNLPPLFCAHGMADPLLDFEMREWFCEEWRQLGNTAELVLCPSGDHTLTHFEVNPAVFEQILLAWEVFMVEQGIWPESAIEGDALME
ncbi:MAG: alpha/beta hydrolase [Akkermansia sp.]|nr:alpha/beta hydrolase [Akkermansia sp.]